MDEDAAQACWHQLELENRQRYEQVQRWLSEDPAYEKWLEQFYSEMNSYEICSESERRF
jgi:hypothetical protein